MRLKGKKVAVLIESDFYEKEIFYYEHRFPEEGAELHFLSRMWGQPSITFKGRKFRGVRGWAGKPTHPPLTDFPIAAYVFAAAFDVISYFGRHHATWPREFYRAGTFVLVGGALVSLFAALTGFWDGEPGAGFRRRNCCLIYRLAPSAPAVVCGDCILRGQAERP